MTIADFTMAELAYLTKTKLCQSTVAEKMIIKYPYYISTIEMRSL